MDNAKSTNALKLAHDEDWHTPQGRLIRDIVFGANDGLVTMVGFVAGATGILTSTHPILLASVAVIIAGSVSMALGAYLSSKAQREFFEHEISREKREIVEMPERERQEVRDAYTSMGFSASEVEMITTRITSDPKLWLRFMLHEELGLTEESFDNPIISGLIVGGAFFVTSWVPILPYFFMSTVKTAFPAAMALSICFLFCMGIAKAHISNTSKIKSGFEVALLGVIAMSIGYVASSLAGKLVPGIGAA